MEATEAKISPPRCLTDKPVGIGIACLSVAGVFAGVVAFFVFGAFAELFSDLTFPGSKQPTTNLTPRQFLDTYPASTPPPPTTGFSISEVLVRIPGLLVITLCLLLLSAGIGIARSKRWAFQVTLFLCVLCLPLTNGASIGPVALAIYCIARLTGKLGAEAPPSAQKVNSTP